MNGHKLLLIGIAFCVFGLGFGMAIFMRLKNLPVHTAMREISELIYETCKTYLVTQGKFLMLLWVVYCGGHRAFTSDGWRRCRASRFRRRCPSFLCSA